MIQSNRCRLLCLALLTLLGAGCAKTRDVATESSIEPTVNSTERAPEFGLSAQPTYQSRPLYCKIAIGPESNKVFWTATDLDGGCVYADLNCNGDLTESGERFELAESLKIKETRHWTTLIPEIEQGEDLHTDLVIKFGKTGDDIKAVVSMKLWGWDDSTTDADLIPLRLSTVEAEAPTIHFNGPLTMGSYRKSTEIPISKEFVFYSLVGTKGGDGGTLTAISNADIPDDAHPKAEFEFPSEDPSQPPIKLTTFLNVRC